MELMLPWMLVMSLLMPSGNQVNTAVGFRHEKECQSWVQKMKTDPTRKAPLSAICIKMPKPMTVSKSRIPV